MTGLLDRIESPRDLSVLNCGELNILCGEIRERLVSTVSKTGGHIASNLGVVELTVALHRVFSTPRDKIIWDVGHQAYVHKLLTGRCSAFGTLRQYRGLSGFPDPAESSHDAFIGGHAGNSISAALGMAVARDRDRGDYGVVAVIGDGSLGSGMALEAVNHAGHLGTRLIIVLNDNGLSISPTIGALYHLLNRVRLDPGYESAKEWMRGRLSALPGGARLWRMGRRMVARLRRCVLPGTFWDNLGFTYLGPVDGHDLGEIEAALQRAHHHETRPVIVHVVTTKGKGYEPAESNAVGYHGISPAAKKSESRQSHSQVFSRSIVELMTRNSRVVAITAAMLDGTGLADAARRFPDRVFDVGICEQHAVTFAAGLAARGFVPVVAIYSTFLQRAYDQVAHDVCLQELPVIFAIDRAGIVGDDGKTHQGAMDISYLRCIPGMTVCAPRDESELPHLLDLAVASGRPVAIRYPRGSGEGLHPGRAPECLGRGELLVRGDDLAIIAIGAGVHPALRAADELRNEGISCAVADARFAKPLDRELIIGLAERTGRIVTVEENAAAGGFGGAVLELLAAEGIDGVSVRTIGLPDAFVEHGTQEFIRSCCGIDAAGIAERVRNYFPGMWPEVYEPSLESIV